MAFGWRGWVVIRLAWLGIGGGEGEVYLFCLGGGGMDVSLCMYTLIYQVALNGAGAFALAWVYRHIVPTLYASCFKACYNSNSQIHIGRPDKVSIRYRLQLTS